MGSSGVSQNDTSPTVPISSAWDLVDDSDSYYRLTFTADGNLDYAIGWYMSEFVEIHVGTYDYDGSILTFSVAPTFEADTMPSLSATLELEFEGDTLKTTYVSGDKLHFRQDGETTTWSKYQDQ